MLFRIAVGGACAAWWCAAGLVGSAGDWPAFRGPHGDGYADASARPPLTWSREDHVAWKVKLPAPGNSSPIVIGDAIYITSADPKGRELTLLCFDRATGAERWKRTVTDDAPSPTHGTNPYAAATPVSDGRTVVAWYGQAGLHAYDLAGKPLWSTPTKPVRHIWGYGSSPVIHRDRVYINTGVGAEACVAAFDLDSGQELWKTVEPGGDDGSGQKGGGWIGSWSTPVVAQVDGREQLLCCLATRVAAFDLDTGKILWHCDGLGNLPRGNLVYTSLMIGDGHAVAMGGFNGPAFGFKLGGSGDVTATQRLWRTDKNNPQRIGSAVVVGDNLFIANAGPGLVQCLDIKTGAERWKARPSAGGDFWASAVLAGGRIYATNQQGTTIVFAPNPDKYEELAENALGERCNATPAFADGDVIIRTFDHLYAIREK